MARQPDLFSGFERMWREMDELFDGALERGRMTGRGFVPRVDVYHCGEETARVVVEVELPAVDPGAIGLEVRGRHLLVGGERRASDSQTRRYQQLEIAQGPFRRAIDLGADVVADEARATYEQGILRVEIPLARPAPLAVRRVSVRGPEDGG